MSKLISREEKLLEEVDKKISKININMKIKLNSINSEFLKILCDFMSRTNQDVSNAIMEFLGFLKSPYVCLKVFKSYFALLFKQKNKIKKNIIFHF